MQLGSTYGSSQGSLLGEKGDFDGRITACQLKSFWFLNFFLFFVSPMSSEGGDLLSPMGAFYHEQDVLKNFLMRMTHERISGFLWYPTRNGTAGAIREGSIIEVWLVVFSATFLLCSLRGVYRASEIGKGKALRQLVLIQHQLGSNSVQHSRLEIVWSKLMFWRFFVFVDFDCVQAGKVKSMTEHTELA